MFHLQCLLCLVLCLCIFSQPGGFYLIFVPTMNVIALTPLKTQPSVFLKRPLLAHCNNDPSLFPALSTSPCLSSTTVFYLIVILCLPLKFKSTHPSIVLSVHFEMVNWVPILKDGMRIFKSSFTLSSLELCLIGCFSTALASATLTTHSHTGFHFSSFNRFNPRCLSFFPLVYSLIC